MSVFMCVCVHFSCLLLSPLIHSSVGGTPTHLSRHPQHPDCSKVVSPVSEPITDASILPP